MAIYKAHIDKTTNTVQTIKEHSENTAVLCRDFSIPKLKDVMYVMGLLHDVGKYQISFQKRIDGKNIKVEHSGCGAKIAIEKFPNAVGYLLAYCIAGHHSGIPDGGYGNDTPDKVTLAGRMKREFEDYSRYQEELSLLSINDRDFGEFLLRDCENNMERVIDKFAFFTRYCYSCLTDADSLDTASFCSKDGRHSLKANFTGCLEKINKSLLSLHSYSELQKARSVLQNQVFQHIKSDAEIYLMNMPTGSGKTLCSVKFALERVLRTNRKRIIYIIPYNSIIEQTADIFENIMGRDVEILRHQSTFFYDEEKDYSEDYRETARYAIENWDAQLIITTAVQFFESIYANKRNKLRKLHNMADSILVFDEAHLMPTKYLQPCLEAISYITKYLNSEAVFLTATMPDYKKLIREYALPNSIICDLVTDTSIFSKFNKCKYQYLETLSEDRLIAEAAKYPSSLIIVNKRAVARELYSLCSGKKFHLSTYMTAFDRSRVINEIKLELMQLEKDYPDLENIPDDRKIIVISTSLIEAGVDLDFYTVFRELAGLDNILQAGGRCNREGKRKQADVFIYTLENQSNMLLRDERFNITKGLINEYEDISCKESISTYYERLYFFNREELTKNTISKRCKNVYSIPFSKYAEDFNIIDTETISIVVSRDKKSKEMIEQLKITGQGNPRKFQKYALAVYVNEFDDLLKQHVVDDFGSGIWCLTNLDYYEEDTGIQFEGKDYIL